MLGYIDGCTFVYTFCIGNVGDVGCRRTRAMLPWYAVTYYLHRLLFSREAIYCRIVFSLINPFMEFYWSFPTWSYAIKSIRWLINRIPVSIRRPAH